jgi:hypothetical protein
MPGTQNSINAPFPFAITIGGTGKTSVTTAPTPTSWAGWDANSNLSANNMLAGYTTTTTSVVNVILTVASTQQQYFTGSTAQTVVLPVTSTLVLGQSFTIVNNSTNVLTVESSGFNVIQAMAAGSQLTVTCILTSGTTAASWATYYTYENPSSDLLPWNFVTTSTQQMAPNQGYVTNNGATLVTYTLPVTAVAGSVLSLAGFSAGGWTIAQNASQEIFFGNQHTTIGTGGSLGSSNQYDQVSLLCVTANTNWVVLGAVGNLNWV